MGRTFIMGLAIATATVACGQQATTGGGGTTAETPTVTVTLPAGDVAAGRQAFLDLKCTACHAVTSEPDFPRPVSANPGPPIGPGTARSDPSYLAAAIVTPSHVLSPNLSPEVRANIEGVLSPMGDFSRVMTVRQMVDLHAYLRSVK
jgi:mono/diheme cytochrome c family protein